MFLAIVFSFVVITQVVGVYYVRVQLKNILGTKNAKEGVSKVDSIKWKYYF